MESELYAIYVYVCLCVYMLYSMFDVWSFKFDVCMRARVCMCIHIFVCFVIMASYFFFYFACNCGLLSEKNFMMMMMMMTMIYHRYILRWLLNICTNSSVAQVYWNGAYSNTFSALNGVKQGGIVSPVLFSICILMGCYTD